MGMVLFTSFMFIALGLLAYTSILTYIVIRGITYENEIEDRNLKSGDSKNDPWDKL